MDARFEDVEFSRCTIVRGGICFKRLLPLMEHFINGVLDAFANSSGNPWNFSHGARANIRTHGADNLKAKQPTVM